MLRTLLAAALICSAGVAQSQPIWVSGDSHGVLLAVIAGLPSVAKNGAHTQEVPSQLSRVPVGSTVWLSTGTNDAVVSLYGFERAVDAVLEIANRRGLKLIWLGPPRVSKPWDSYADKADTYLALKAPNYVSLRAVAWRKGERSSDGIHLSVAGTRRVISILKRHP